MLKTYTLKYFGGYPISDNFRQILTNKLNNLPLDTDPKKLVFVSKDLIDVLNKDFDLL